MPPQHVHNTDRMSCSMPGMIHHKAGISANASGYPNDISDPPCMPLATSAPQTAAERIGNSDEHPPHGSGPSRIASGTLSNDLGSSDTHPHPAASQISIDQQMPAHHVRNIDQTSRSVPSISPTLPDISTDASGYPDDVSDSPCMPPHLGILPVTSALQTAAERIGNSDEHSTHGSGPSHIAPSTLANVLGTSDTHRHPAASQISIDRQTPVHHVRNIDRTSHSMPSTIPHIADISANALGYPNNIPSPPRMPPHLVMQPATSESQIIAEQIGNSDEHSPHGSGPSRIASGTSANVLDSSNTHSHPAAPRITTDQPTPAHHTHNADRKPHSTPSTIPCTPGTSATICSSLDTYSDHIASPVPTGLQSMTEHVGTSQETSPNMPNTPLARSGSVPDTSGPLDTRIDLIEPLATSDLRTAADPVDDAPPPPYNFDDIPDDTPSPPATVFPTFAACPMSLWAPRASTSLGFAFAFSVRGRWAGTMPVLPSPPEANDLESIDEDSPCPSLLASPNLALSQSSPPSHAAPIAAQSLLCSLLQAAPIAAHISKPPSGYRTLHRAM